MPSTPVAVVTAGARVSSGGAVGGGGSTEQVATAAAERTKFEPFTGAPLRSCMRTPSPSLHKMNNSSVATSSTSSASDDVTTSSFVTHRHRQQSSTVTPPSGNSSFANDESTPTSSRDQLSVTRGGGERHRQRSRDRGGGGGARDASRDRSRERSRSPWQMMLASNRRIRQPGPSMSSLGRSIARSLTPSLDQMTADQPVVDHDDSSSCSDQNSCYPPAAAAEPAVAPPSLQRGRSEPNLIDAVNDASAQQQHETEVYGGTSADSGGVTSSYSSTSPSTRSYSTLPTAGKRASIARERRMTMGGMTSCGDGDDGSSTLYSPRSDGLMVSQRFLRLSQGDLTSQSTSNLEALMQNTTSPSSASSAQSASSSSSPLERGVRRTNSLRDFRRSRAAAAAAAAAATANSDVSADAQPSRNATTGVTATNQTPVNVFNDDDSGLVGYVFHV